ncbi:TadE/TadG family type IV pilus assembly protein [Nocardioides zeae]|uniref:TadE/TadG family type IV pilus assembly protein n=1 Tax=Nocardioides imazamoxiresistens TaxID=3231893 RepID=A0ABU3PXC3_9ACTN|nr:TadE/TadG family type IV pilus assembly protein [Nocardioides zeae]MDT9593874.1 TadE/TadG family type IV pilus assembly protein [Nocardioides zeae]
MRKQSRHHVRRGTRREQEGAAAVEFALVLPLLLLLVFGIISYGFMLSFRGSLSQAAAEGARAAAVSVNASGREAAARGAVNDAINSYGVTCAGANLTRNGNRVGSCTIEVVPCANPGGATTPPQCVRVDLEYDYADNELIPLPIVDAFMPESIGYTASARVS